MKQPNTVNSNSDLRDNYEKQFESVKVRVIARFAMFLTGSFIFFQQLKYTVQYSRYKTYLIRNWNMIMPSYSDDPVGE